MKLREAIRKIIKEEKTDLGSVLHTGSTADEFLGHAYGDLNTLKFAFDSMEEIPSYLQPAYNQTMKAIDAIIKARQETTQLRGMIKKLPR